MDFTTYWAFEMLSESEFKFIFKNYLFPIQTLKSINNYKLLTQ